MFKQKSPLYDEISTVLMDHNISIDLVKQFYELKSALEVRKTLNARFRKNGLPSVLRYIRPILVKNCSIKPKVSNSVQIWKQINRARSTIAQIEESLHNLGNTHENLDISELNSQLVNAHEELDELVGKYPQTMKIERKRDMYSILFQLKRSIINPRVKKSQLIACCKILGRTFSFQSMPSKAQIVRLLVNWINRKQRTILAKTPMQEPQFKKQLRYKATDSVMFDQELVDEWCEGAVIESISVKSTTAYERTDDKRSFAKNGSIFLSESFEQFLDEEVFADFQISLIGLRYRNFKQNYTVIKKDEAKWNAVPYYTQIQKGLAFYYAFVDIFALKTALQTNYTIDVYPIHKNLKFATSKVSPSYPLCLKLLGFWTNEDLKIELGKVAASSSKNKEEILEYIEMALNSETLERSKRFRAVKASQARLLVPIHTNVPFEILARAGYAKLIFDKNIQIPSISSIRKDEMAEMVPYCEIPQEAPYDYSILLSETYAQIFELDKRIKLYKDLIKNDKTADIEELKKLLEKSLGLKTNLIKYRKILIRHLDVPREILNIASYKGDRDNAIRAWGLFVAQFGAPRSSFIRNVSVHNKIYTKAKPTPARFRYLTRRREYIENLGGLKELVHKFVDGKITSLRCPYSLRGLLTYCLQRAKESKIVEKRLQIIQYEEYINGNKIWRRSMDVFHQILVEACNLGVLHETFVFKTIPTYKYHIIPFFFEGDWTMLNTKMPSRAQKRYENALIASELGYKISIMPWYGERNGYRQRMKNYAIIAPYLEFENLNL